MLEVIWEFPCENFLNLLNAKIGSLFHYIPKKKVTGISIINAVNVIRPVNGNVELYMEFVVGLM